MWFKHQIGCFDISWGMIIRCPIVCWRNPYISRFFLGLSTASTLPAVRAVCRLLNNPKLASTARATILVPFHIVKSMQCIGIYVDEIYGWLPQCLNELYRLTDRAPGSSTNDGRQVDMLYWRKCLMLTTPLTVPLLYKTFLGPRLLTCIIFNPSMDK